ncbi:hypothetical protein INR49_025830 [Caranx melampygus]|nr:hypothetical protein INR49_025830 [Caranx melampygus]
MNASAATRRSAWLSFFPHPSFHPAASSAHWRNCILLHLSSRPATRWLRWAIPAFPLSVMCAPRNLSSYIILEDVPDGKWPRCCFCLRPRFVLLHLLQDRTHTSATAAAAASSDCNSRSGVVSGSTW